RRRLRGGAGRPARQRKARATRGGRRREHLTVRQSMGCVNRSAGSAAAAVTVPFAGTAVHSAAPRPADRLFETVGRGDGHLGIGLAELG
ncbi:hypothetical protein ACFU9X_43530, partial [Streptomyces atratus]|uniref:hypothetical protein n=1 Tax=Streptomyces atratus TaxID=1893 RepID=UPI00369DA146